MANAIKQRLARVLAREFHRDGDYDMAEADEQKQFQNAAAAVLAELAGELRDARRYKRLKDGMAGGCEAEYAVTYNVGFDWYETSQSTIDALLDYKAIDEARHG